MLPVLVYHHRAATSTLLGCSTVRDVHLRVDSSYEHSSECGWFGAIHDCGLGFSLATSYSGVKL